MKTYECDIVVVGAGPGGSMAARYCAQGGLKTILIEKKAEICMSADSFSPDLYEKYDVKKGLRDSKGNGVVVGLTTVSEVNGLSLIHI